MAVWCVLGTARHGVQSGMGHFSCDVQSVRGQATTIDSLAANHALSVLFLRTVYACKGAQCPK
eukprot:6213247-Pleurochrysis_carterae.AAC.2